MPRLEVKCVYCGTVTGSTSTSASSSLFPLLFASLGKTVCSGCQWGKHRDEAFEVAAGMRPWAKESSFPVLSEFLGHKRMNEARSAELRAAWEREQAAIRDFNDAHAGYSGEPESELERARR
jgi:hypothetical protein